MKQIYVIDLKPGISLFGELFVIKTYKRGSTKEGQPYIDVELADRTGNIRGKIWSNHMEKCEPAREGDVASIDGLVKDYKQTAQVDVTALSVMSEYDPVDFQIVSEYSPEEMALKIQGTIGEVKNRHLKELLNNCFSENVLEKFLVASAARGIHHAYRGGLAEHTVEMITLAEPILIRYPKINKDLLLAGILLHDIGKMTEYETVLTTTLTTPGRLLGHIFISAETVKNQAPKEMPASLLNEVLHLILSHHGKKEFGSPVLPQTVEAVALSSLDRMSADLNSSYQAVHGMEEGQEFTPFLSNLGTEFYRSPYLDTLTNEDIPF